MNDPVVPKTSPLALISVLQETYPNEPVALLAITPPSNEPVPLDVMFPFVATWWNEPVPFVPVPLALILPLAVMW